MIRSIRGWFLVQAVDCELAALPRRAAFFRFWFRLLG